MKIIKNVLLLLLVLSISYFLIPVFGNVYIYFFPSNLGGALPTDAIISLIGLPLAYIFFLTFLFTAFGDKHKYWWIGILLIPAFWFEIYFDLSHLYFPIVLALLGWLIGIGFNKLVSGSS